MNRKVLARDEYSLSRRQAIENTLPKVRRALESIQYGEVIIKVEGGKPIWVDKYERERVG